MYPTHITHYFEATVAAHPDRVAVYDGERSITFQQLHDRVLYEAMRLSQKLGGKTGRIVGVFLPKSLEAIVAQLAILYSGNAYMNLDIKWPDQRIHAILEQTHPILLITGEHASHCAKDAAIFTLENEQPLPLEHDKREAVLSLCEQCIDTDLLCLINTSGSTGTPKAVALTHRSFIDYVNAVYSAGLVEEGEVVASLAPIIFDHYSFELCLLAVKGCTLVLIPDTYAAFPIKMLELMARHKTTFLFWVPTIMVNIANMDLLGRVTLPTLKKIWFAGEVFPTAKFNYWREHFPEVLFVNLYGPTEITVDCVYYIVKRPLRDDEPIPIGKPLQNTGIFVLDENNEPIYQNCPGKEGELCVRGSSLALGYYNNPEKTAAAFVQNPLNTAYPETIYRTGDIVAWNEYGELVFRGRQDTLIKHSGYRIELTEIEHVAVNALKIASNCCALYDTNAKKIVLVYEAPSPLSEKDLRQKLGKALPRYMVPTVYRQVTEMPRNTNGKIDRLELRRIFLEQEKIS